MSFSSLALAADSLASHWTEVVTYFRGTFCIENWFLGVVTEAAVISGFFFLIHTTPSHLPGPCMGTLTKCKIIIVK